MTCGVARTQQSLGKVRLLNRLEKARSSKKKICDRAVWRELAMFGTEQEAIVALKVCAKANPADIVEMAMVDRPDVLYKVALHTEFSVLRRALDACRNSAARTRIAMAMVGAEKTPPRPVKPVSLFFARRLSHMKALIMLGDHTKLQDYIEAEESGSVAIDPRIVEQCLDLAKRLRDQGAMTNKKFTDETPVQQADAHARERMFIVACLEALLAVITPYHPIALR